MKPNAFLIFIRQKLKIFGGFVAFTFILLNINILENAKNINIIKNIIKLLHFLSSLRPILKVNYQCPLEILFL